TIGQGNEYLLSFSIEGEFDREKTLDRHPRRATPLRSGGARARGVRVAGPAPPGAGFPRRRAHARARVGGRRASRRRRRSHHPVAEPRALRVRGGRPPEPPRVLPAGPEIPRRARLPALPPP